MTALGISPEVQKLLDNQRIKLAGAEIPMDVSVEISTKLKNAIALEYMEDCAKRYGDMFTLRIGLSTEEAHLFFF